MIEQDQSHSLILGATNHPEILDAALFRRFDDLLHYELPDETHIANVLKTRLGRIVAKGVSWRRLASKFVGLSYAEVARATDEVKKSALIERKDQISEKDIYAALNERHVLSARLTNNNR